MRCGWFVSVPPRTMPNLVGPSLPGVRSISRRKTGKIHGSEVPDDGKRAFDANTRNGGEQKPDVDNSNRHTVAPGTYVDVVFPGALPVRRCSQCPKRLLIFRADGARWRSSTRRTEFICSQTLTSAQIGTTGQVTKAAWRP